jgi:transposase
LSVTASFDAVTSFDTISLEDAAAGDKGLLVIERCFRTLKRTRIQMEPMYHGLPRRIEAHIKLCVFALLTERVAELKCKEPRPQTKRTIATLQASELCTPKFRFFQRNEPSAELLRKLKSLEIPMHEVVLDLQSGTSNV